MMLLIHKASFSIFYPPNRALTLIQSTVKPSHSFNSSPSALHYLTVKPSQSLHYFLIQQSHLLHYLPVQFTYQTTCQSSPHIHYTIYP